MSTEEELEREVEAQARRVQAQEDLPGEAKLQDAEVNTEHQLSLAKQEQERKLKYSDDTSD